MQSSSQDVKAVKTNAFGMKVVRVQGRREERPGIPQNYWEKVVGHSPVVSDFIHGNRSSPAIPADPF
jgi:hypothetical protein